MVSRHCHSQSDSLGLTDVEVKGGRSVENKLDARRLYHFVERIRLGNVWNDGNIQRILVNVGVRIADDLGLLFTPHGCDDLVALLEELVKRVG